MAVNPYDNPFQGRYQSMYIPLPYQELSQIAQQKQQQHEQALGAAEHVTDPLAKLNLARSVQGYTPEGIGNINLNWQNELEADKQSLQLKKDKLIQDYSNQSITNDEFNRGVRDILNQGQNIYSKYKPLEDISKQITTQQELVGKNQDFGFDKPLGHEYLAYNTQFAKDILSGNLTDYTPTNIAEKYDIGKDISEHVKDFEETDLGSGASAGKYITEIEKYGVTHPRVIDYVNRTWENSSNAKYSNLKIKQAIALGQINPKDYGKYMNQEKQNFAKAIVDKVVHERKKVNLQADPYSLFDYKQDAKAKADLISSVGIVEGENIVNYDYNPEVGGFINPKTGLFDLAYGMSKTEEDWSKPGTITIGDKKYTTADIPKDKYKLEITVSGPVAIDKKSGERIPFTRERSPQNSLNDARKYIYQQASRLGLNQYPNETEEQFANRILNENKLHQQGVTKNIELDHQVAENMDKYLIGKDGSKFQAYYDDAIILGDKNPKPISEFIEDQGIDTKTIKHNTVSFDKKHPGYVLFTAKNKDGKDVQFYAKSKNEEFKNSMEAATQITNTFKDYFEGKNISSQKVNINNRSFQMVGEPLKEDGKQFLALNENREPVIVNITNNGQVIETNIKDIKVNSVLNWMQSNEAKPFTRKIKENKNFEFDQEED